MTLPYVAHIVPGAHCWQYILSAALIVAVLLSVTGIVRIPIAYKAILRETHRPRRPLLVMTSLVQPWLAIIYVCPTRQAAMGAPATMETPALKEWSNCCQQLPCSNDVTSDAITGPPITRGHIIRGAR